MAGPLHSQTIADLALVKDLVSRCQFPAGSPSVDCAVSGGADSSALAVLATAAGFDVHLFHVDHGIRSGSGAEAELVKALATSLGAQFSALRCDVEDGPDLEARARAARHGVLPPGTLFGHTMDDQAETVLMRMMRGTGPAGLAAMSPAGHPLLGIRRSETVALCRGLGIRVFDDPTNTDTRFTRNRVRAELLPLMCDIAKRDVVPLLARLATQSAEQAELIDELSDSVEVTDALELVRAPRPVATAAIRSWWSRETGDQYPPDAGAIDRIMAVAQGVARSTEIGDGWTVKRTNQRLRIEGPGGAGDRHAARD